MRRQYGDGLDDDYVADDLVAQSEGEEVDIASSVEDEDRSPSGSASTLPQLSSEDPTKAKKRKRKDKVREKKAKVRTRSLGSYRAPNSPFKNLHVM